MDDNPTIILLQQKLDEHIEEYKSHIEDDKKRWDNFFIAQERNTQSITNLTESTRDLISAWEAATGTVKTMSAIGGFVKWLGGFAILGTLIKWIIDYGKG